MAQGEILDYTIDVRQIEAFLQRFPVTAPEIVRTNLRAAMDDSLEYTQNQVADRTPVNTGLLRGSIYNEITTLRADVRGVDMAGIVSSSDYEPKVWAMEWGRRPGKMPPVEAIALWVKRRGIAGSYNVKTRKRLGGRQQRDREDLSLAWAIAKHIARYGTKEHLMFEQGFTASLSYIDQTFSHATDDILRHWSTV